MQLAIQIAGGIAWIAVLAGLLLLAYRSGKLAGGVLVGSMIAIVAWSFWGGATVAWIDSLVFEPLPAVHDSADSSNAASALAAMGHTQSVGVVCESLLMLWFGLAFLLAVASVSHRARPNNSFEQNQFSGSA
jgi:hypothetical protein